MHFEYPGMYKEFSFLLIPPVVWLGYKERKEYEKI